MLDTLPNPINPDQVLKPGQSMLEEDYHAAADATPSMQGYIAHAEPAILHARGLDKFKEVGPDMLARTVCLPKTTLMALRHLGVDRSLTLADFYELGVLAHVNDRPSSSDGETEKGFPSFHRVTMDTYLRYALEFAQIAGLHGGIITHFNDVQFANPVLSSGGVAIVSVDNLFIPDVMNTDLDPVTFKPSRHAELVHGKLGDDLVLSDVTNNRNGVRWDTRNRVVSASKLNTHLTCPRLNDGLTRAIVLTKDASTWEKVKGELGEFGQVEEPRYNPILSPHFGRGVVPTLNSIRTTAAQGLAQWDMIK